MNWVTILWAAAAAVPLTFGGIHMLVWCGNRRSPENLLFHLATVSVAGIALFELAIMHSSTVTEYGTLHRWAHVPVFSTIILFTGFILFHFQAGRWWLAAVLLVLRMVILVMNFVFPPTFNYSEITRLIPVRFLGETITTAETVESPWARLAEFSLLLFIAFIVDATVTLWRRGGADNRRRAILTGASFGFYVFLVSCNVWLVHTGTVRMPYIIGPCFVIIVVTMGYELSRDVIRAARMAEELRENSGSMSLAADAAQVALWRWEPSDDTLWMSPNGRRLYGIPEHETLTMRRLFDAIHPADREETRSAIMRSIEEKGAFRTEYRTIQPDGTARWIGARGRAGSTHDGRALLVRGVSIDITERKNIEEEASRHRAELAHLTRVTTLSELSGSLAHELNQPLAIILSNAQAARRLLALTPPDLDEVREILDDIVFEDQRAGEVIRRLRSLLKRGETTFLPLTLNETVEEVIRLTNTDLVARGVAVMKELAPHLPPASGDAIQLQQVILNLILNGIDAMADAPPGSRALHLSTSSGGDTIRFSLRDEGTGLPADVEKLFEPFHTTKSHGLGMGLAISRSIITAHHGRLWAEPHGIKGAVFHFELPAAAAAKKIPEPERMTPI